MKQRWRKLTALIMTGMMTMSLAACGDGASGNNGSEEGETSSGKDCTIGVAFYTDAGPAVDGTKAYLEAMSDTLHVEFKYTVLTQTDEAANLTKIQELISSGVDGIICTMDLGMTSIMEECEAAGVYLGGYLSDYDTSYTSAYEEVFQNDYFVGTAADGACVDELEGRHEFLDSLLEYNERNAEDPITHVSLAMFPVWAFPSQQIIADEFMKAVEEYNETAEVQITVDPVNEETDVLQFSPMDSTYFAKHADSQAIIGLAAGTSFIYPTMVSAGTDKELKLFTSGFDGGEETNFGTKGTGTYQHVAVSAIEAVNYPLVLLLNKINGVEFSDQPEDAERKSTAQIIINSDEDMDLFMESVYYTGNAEDAMFTAEEVLNMTAYANPDATYAALTETLDKMTVEDLK